MIDDLPRLRGLWQRCTGKPTGADAPAQHQAQIRALYARGIFMDEALHFLFHQRPTFEAFLAWITTRTRARPAHAFDTVDDVLTAVDLQFWKQHGYVVLRGAVPQDLCQAAQAAIWDYLGASLDDRASWYRTHPGKVGFMLQFSDHPALETIRHQPRIRRAYQQLYRSDAIYPTIDKVSFSPPQAEGTCFTGSPLHWDTSLALPIPFKLQGLLYLGDCAASHGAFHCVPGFQHHIADWLATVPPGHNPREWALQQLQPVAVPGQAGDFIIWHQALPHCATPNLGAVPRMVQYLTYHADDGVEQEQWI
ncbi:phytanoyl-CoA dioxygenase family protein [Janthinobacterium sp. RB2R34]|uniref:phytanoyl-CoA dioxygenase family protein n=1 Tax=Janthinobacterium sp. RB2R34 TaxID=3424193 RepID=UPI003F231B2A